MASVESFEQAPEQEEETSSPVVKQFANVYTMMLIISFLALTIGCIMLYLEMRRYDFDSKASAQLHAAPSTQMVQTGNEMDSFRLLA